MLDHCQHPDNLVQVQQQLNVSAESLQLTDDFLKKSYDLGSILPAGHHINKPEVLFRNITDEEVEQLRDRCDTCAAPGSCAHLLLLNCTTMYLVSSWFLNLT